jgi:hypothetical protein
VVSFVVIHPPGRNNGARGIRWNEEEESSSGSRYKVCLVLKYEAERSLQEAERKKLQVNEIDSRASLCSPVDSF